jgi:hypothetical protein
MKLTPGLMASFAGGRFEMDNIKTLPLAKTKAMADLFPTIKPTDLIAVCQSLGWQMGNDKKLPKEKHYKVAILETLIKTAKAMDWHVIHDAGLFYIYNSTHWIPLEKAEMMQLLMEAAIRMGNKAIESRDNNFVKSLISQAENDGFFAERNSIKQCIINLNNGSLVLNETGITLKLSGHYVANNPRILSNPIVQSLFKSTISIIDGFHLPGDARVLACATNNSYF